MRFFNTVFASKYFPLNQNDYIFKRRWLSYARVVSSRLCVANKYRNININLKTDEEYVYGIQPVIGALSFNRRDFQVLYMRESIVRAIKTKAIDVNPWHTSIFTLAQALKVPIKTAQMDELVHLVNGRSHQSVVLQATSLPTFTFTANVLNTLASSDDPQNDLAEAGSQIILFLDQVKDVMNLGSILRSASFYGVKNILISAAASAKPSALISKLSAGAMEGMQFYVINDIGFCMRNLKEYGFTLIGTSGVDELCNNAKEPLLYLPLHRVTSEHLGVHRLNGETKIRPLVLAIGSETSGLREEILSACHLIVRIPGSEDHSGLYSRQPIFDQAYTCSKTTNRTTSNQLAFRMPSLGRTGQSLSRAAMTPIATDSLATKSVVSPLMSSLNVAVATGILLNRFFSLRQSCNEPTPELDNNQVATPKAG